MKTFGVCFTNFGPYHLARLRALAEHFERSDGRLIAYEVAGAQALYPWTPVRQREPFEWVTLFPGGVLESISGAACKQAIGRALERDRPHALGVVGYVRPESMAMLGWARANRRPTVLMSESQEVDHPRVWWKETVKRQRVRRFSAALVGGPSHRDYLVTLGMPADRIALGYNAVDSDWFTDRAEACRAAPDGRWGLPAAPYFLAVSRFAPEKNLPRLIRAFARYRARAEAHAETPWDLVLCGDGPAAADAERAIEQSGNSPAIHRPGFLQSDELTRWLAFASAFVHPSLSEPWGLVVNEAAACGLPLLVSDRAGCVETFVPEGPETTGQRFDGRDVDAITSVLQKMANSPAEQRLAMGQRATAIAREWGPDRFARGTLGALEMAEQAERSRGLRRPSFVG